MRGLKYGDEEGKRKGRERADNGSKEKDEMKREGWK